MLIYSFLEQAVLTITEYISINLYNQILDVVLPPVEAEAFLDRKQLLLPGQKKATNRTWKNSYTVLCGQLLCFFKNKDDFAASKASCPPINIHNATCTIAEDYLKRKYTFRLIIIDGSEFLFACNSEVDMMDWINKITFRARLPPSQQLLHFDIPKVKMFCTLKVLHRYTTFIYRTITILKLVRSRVGLRVRMWPIR